MGLVAGLHVAGLYLIASSLGIVPPLIQETPPFVLEQPREVAPPDAPPEPVPRPEFDRPLISVPTPEVPPDSLPTEVETLGAVIDDHPPEVPPMVPPAHQPRLVGVRQDARHPLSQPVYPSTDIRQGNEGTVELEIYVLPSGRVGEVRVLKSTGSATLDQSAIEEARRKWRLLPATRDGEPYAQWHRLKVTFNLKNR